MNAVAAPILKMQASSAKLLEAARKYVPEAMIEGETAEEVMVQLPQQYKLGARSYN